MISAFDIIVSTEAIYLKQNNTNLESDFQPKSDTNGVQLLLLYQHHLQVTNKK